jgi:phosphate transport system substrate-binding protein
VKRAIVATAVAAATCISTTAIARDTIFIVGSSTVYPFATVVAENFGRTSKFTTPKIESTGSGGGLKLFCAGVGLEHPDVTNASRRIKATEFETCQANGVEDIVEVMFGYDGITVGNSKTVEQMDFTPKDLFLGLAKDVPGEGDTLVPNPYKTWKEVNPELPDIKIEVMGPPPTSGTRDAFAELVMEEGCKTYDFIAAMKKEDKQKYKAVCHAIREDGVYIDAGENDNLIVKKLEVSPGALGIFGFNFLDQNREVIQGSMINGVAPSFESIADASYPLARSLQFYVKKAHVGEVPGLEDYVAEFTSDTALGEDGYLVEKGLIPLPEGKRREVAEIGKGLIEMGAPEPK